MPAVQTPVSQQAAAVRAASVSLNPANPLPMGAEAAAGEPTVTPEVVPQQPAVQPSESPADAAARDETAEVAHEGITEAIPPIEAIADIAGAEIPTEQVAPETEAKDSSQNATQIGSKDVVAENASPRVKTNEEQLVELRQQAIADMQLVLDARFPNASPEEQSQLQVIVDNATPQDLLHFHQILNRRFSPQEGRLTLQVDPRIKELLRRIPQQMTTKLQRLGVSEEVIGREIAGKQLAALSANNKELRILQREFPKLPLLALLWKVLGLLGLTVTMDLTKQVFPESIGKIL